MADQNGSPAKISIFTICKYDAVSLAKEQKHTFLI